MINILVSLIIGAVCGWLAGYIMKSGHGLLMNIILGIVGGFVGGFIFNLIGLSINGILGSIIKLIPQTQTYSMLGYRKCAVPISKRPLKVNHFKRSPNYLFIYFILGNYSLLI